jgi:hypothetical protein
VHVRIESSLFTPTHGEDNASDPIPVEQRTRRNLDSSQIDPGVLLVGSVRRRPRDHHPRTRTGTAAVARPAKSNRAPRFGLRASPTHRLRRMPFVLLGAEQLADDVRRVVVARVEQHETCADQRSQIRPVVRFFNVYFMGVQAFVDVKIFYCILLLTCI